VQLELDSARLPRVEGVDLDDALTGGEDHALVATVAAGTALPDGVVRIGTVRPGSGVSVLGHDPGARSWEHFSRTD